LKQLNGLRYIFILFIVCGLELSISQEQSYVFGAISKTNYLVISSGEDTSRFDVHITEHGTQATLPNLPLSVESDIIITQIFNISNTDSLAHIIEVCVLYENFGEELHSLKIYLVSPSSLEILVLEINDAGDIVSKDIQVSIPPKEEWSIKITGCYDSGTRSTQSNTITFVFQIKQ